MNQQLKEAQVLQQLVAYVLSILAIISLSIQWLELHVRRLVVYEAQLVQDLDHDRRRVAEVGELFEAREVRSLSRLLAQPLAPEHVAYVGDCLLVVEMNELEGLVLQPLPVFVQVRVLADLVESVDLQF